MNTVERPLGRRITGPSALGTDRARLWQLTRTMAVTDFKLKFFGSVLGYLWQLVRPLMLFGVLFVVFTQVVDLGKGVEFFATALLLGIVLFSFLNEATSQAVQSLITRENLVRKVEFPRMAVPLSVVLTAVMNLGLNLVAVFVFLLIQGGGPQLDWLQLPFLIAALALLATGLALLLSAAFPRYRDVQPIWDVVLQALFYGSPIFYPVQVITGEHAETIIRALLCNPFAAIVQQARHALIDPSHPSAAAAMGGAEWLLIPVGITLFICWWGFRVFRREAPKIAERL